MFTTSDLPPMAPHFQSFFSLFNAPMDEEALNLSRALALQTLMNLQMPQPMLPFSLPNLSLPTDKKITTLEDLLLSHKAAEASRLLSENSRKRSFPPVIDREEAVDCLLHIAEGMEPGVTKEMFDETLQRILDEEINDGRSSCSDSCDNNSDRLSPPRALSAFRKVSRLSDFSSVQKDLSAVNINEASTLLWRGSLQFASNTDVPVECHLVEDVNRRMTKDHLDQLSAPRLFCTTAQTPESKTRAASELSFASSHAVCVFVPSGNSLAEKKLNGDLLKTLLDNSVGIVDVASKESTMYIFPSAAETELAKMIEKSPIFINIRESDLTYFPGVLAQK